MSSFTKNDVCTILDQIDKWYEYAIANTYKIYKIVSYGVEIPLSTSFSW